MARPIILGVVGDSATGKTTLTKGLVEILGSENVTHIGMDDYHCYDRQERKEHEITPLNPACNYMDIIGQHLAHLRNGEPILKPHYKHSDGTFGRPDYVKPQRFVLIEGLLGYHTPELSSNFDVRVYLAPPENLRREWKVKRDTTKRGYTEEQVLAELDMREPDSEAFIRPQRSRADIVVSFQPGVKDDPDHLDAVLTLREGLPQPDLSSLEGGADAIEVEQRTSERRIRIPGEIDKERGAAIEEAIWEQMHFARHLRTEQLGLFAIGTDEEHRSESLAITQVLILYHLVMAKATAAIGGDDVANGRSDTASGVPSPA
jgi:phosphoribulokinase